MPLWVFTWLLRIWTLLLMHSKCFIHWAISLSQKSWFKQAEEKLFGAILYLLSAWECVLYRENVKHLGITLEGSPGVPWFSAGHISSMELWGRASSWALVPVLTPGKTVHLKGALQCIYKPCLQLDVYHKKHTVCTTQKDNLVLLKGMSYDSLLLKILLCRWNFFPWGYDQLNFSLSIIFCQPSWTLVSLGRNTQHNIWNIIAFIGRNQVWQKTSVDFSWFSNSTNI